jgi:hypothetical protein
MNRSTVAPREARDMVRLIDFAAFLRTTIIDDVIA